MREDSLLLLQIGGLFTLGTTAATLPCLAAPFVILILNQVEHVLGRRRVLVIWIILQRGSLRQRGVQGVLLDFLLLILLVTAAVLAVVALRFLTHAFIFDLRDLVV